MFLHDIVICIRNHIKNRELYTSQYIVHKLYNILNSERRSRFLSKNLSGVAGKNNIILVSVAHSVFWFWNASHF